MQNKNQTTPAHEIDNEFLNYAMNFCNHPDRDYCQDCRNCPATNELAKYK